MKAAPILAVLAGLTACGGHERDWEGDPEAYGLALVTASEGTWASAPGVRERLRAVLEYEAQEFGFDAHALAGERIVVQAGALSACPVPPAGQVELGCEDPTTSTIWLTTDHANCLEQSELVHEILHAYIGDPGHAGTRWAEVHRIQDHLEAAHPDCFEW